MFDFLDVYPYLLPIIIFFGRIVDVMNNKVLQEVNAPHYGMLFTIREFPMVYEGALLARILIKDENGEEKAYE